MSDFNGEDYEFAAGAIKGLRSWKADKQGRLRGVTHTTVWLPSENVSVCKDPGGSYEPCPKRERRRTDPGGYYPSLTITYHSDYDTTCDDPTCTPSGHFVAATETHLFDPNHSCGFWAYDEHHFQEHGDVIGVIEGYGKTTIGTKGFRCEKARIVALCRKHGGGDLSLSLWLRLQQLYPAAKFYEDRDQMVTAHGAVMRGNWDQPDEAFWAADELPKDEDTYSAIWRTYRNAALSMPSRYWSGGVA